MDSFGDAWVRLKRAQALHRIGFGEAVSIAMLILCLFSALAPTEDYPSSSLERVMDLR